LAGQQAVQHSANPEAISHLTAALELLMTRPETPERAAQELTLRLAVGPPLSATQGFTAPAMEQNYLQARALCDQLGDSPQRFPVLWGLWLFHQTRGELRTAQALTEECLQIAEQAREVGLLLQAHRAAGITFLIRGEFVRARVALAQSVALYQPQHQALILHYGGANPKVVSLGFLALGLWYLGYPEQALIRSHEALQLAQELAHPHILVEALAWTAWLHLERGEGPVTQERADAMVALGSEQGFPQFLAWGTLQRGAALILQEQWEEGVAQVQQGLEVDIGEGVRTMYLAWLAEGYRGAEQVDEGLAAVAEALRLVEKNDERIYEAEVYRIKGELLLQKAERSR
jgi:predicted ATPase